MRLVLDAEPEPITVDPTQSALVVVDMQNFDSAPGGEFDLLGVDTTHGRKVVEPIRRVLTAARAAGLTIVYTQNIIPKDRAKWPDETSPWYWKSRRNLGKNPELERGMCIEGNWGAEIVDELAPQDRDLVIPKTCYSGFVRTDLDLMLRRRGIRYLFLSGIGTPTCVEATARDAYFYEYWPILLADCCGAIAAETHEQALFAIKRRYGWVTSSEAFLAAINKSQLAQV
jgi:ureidoacrylate peracid hydrolase